ncbi:MAG: hypothetical protein WCS98_07975 [Bacillota bacterium]|nr:hypothetical protein [Bacillota bacterium]MDD3851279.1 hypothetical protein [Bacillota bacterium]
MGPEIITLWGKRTEQSIISISEKVSDAMEMLQKAKKAVARSEGLLIKAQLELEELFIGLNENIGNTE